MMGELMKNDVTGITVRAEDLGCDRGERPVFRGVGFEIAPGEVLEIHGRNGVGKSSLLRQIAGLVPPTAGTLRWKSDGAEAWEEGAPSAHMRFLSHRNALKPALTALENLCFWARLDTVPEAHAHDALQAVGLEEAADKPARALSAGQQRRVALARLLLAPRALWIMDEPTAALDKASEEAVSRLIEDHCSKGGSAIVATHKVLPLAARALRFE